MQRVRASRPRTVRLPVAYKLVKNKLLLAKLSKKGVRLSALPYIVRYSAERLSTEMRRTLRCTSVVSLTIFRSRAGALSCLSTMLSASFSGKVG